MELQTGARQCKQASISLAALPTHIKDAALLKIKRSLTENRERIVKENTVILPRDCTPEVKPL